MKQGTLNFKKKTPTGDITSNPESQIVTSPDKERNATPITTLITSIPDDLKDKNLHEINSKRKVIITDEEEELSQALLITNPEMKIDKKCKIYFLN